MPQKEENSWECQEFRRTRPLGVPGTPRESMELLGVPGTPRYAKSTDRPKTKPGIRSTSQGPAVPGGWREELKNR